MDIENLSQVNLVSGDADLSGDSFNAAIAAAIEIAYGQPIDEDLNNYTPKQRKRNRVRDRGYGK